MSNHRYLTPWCSVHMSCCTIYRQYCGSNTTRPTTRLDQLCCDNGLSLQLVALVSRSLGQSAAAPSYGNIDPLSHSWQPPDQHCCDIGSSLQLVSCKSLKIAYYTAAPHSGVVDPRKQVETLLEKDSAQLLQQLLASKLCNLCPVFLYHEEASL